MTQHMLVQANAQGNGSNKCGAGTSSSANDTDTTNNSTTTTTTNNITTDHHHHLHQAHEVPMAVLRHRVTAVNSNAGTVNDSAPPKGPKNGLTHLIDANDYLGNTADRECKSLMATSPSKKEMANTLPGSFTSALGGDKFPNLNTSLIPQRQPPSPPPSPGSYSSSSSSSKTTSNSTSTTSSVIATPILRRNGNVVKQQQEEQPLPDDNITTIAQAGNANGTTAGKSSELEPDAEEEHFLSCYGLQTGNVFWSIINGNNNQRHQHHNNN
ncbi:putative uncharacterized protein DDB_G0277255 [Musca vetustissima]|uniref:putative uncharacterized protein DDB_G0277255 n=1 Tax=Musca vetustissima TaxID=27455 RepID=UPI002AB708EC|nr:putative uncharacterized protein DDB_G0277255 [Musca vetustissima]